jgi:hypothetical protein
MLGQRGKAWRVAIIWLLILVGMPGWGNAAICENQKAFWPGWSAPLAVETFPSALEAQLLGDRPADKNPSQFGSSLAEILPGLAESHGNGSTLRFLRNVELRISFLYNGDRTGPERPIQSHLLFKYSMDYAVLPNLRVGLSGFLFHPCADEKTYFQRRFGDTVLGFGPGVKYDLGRWSFTFQSQVDTGDRDRREGFQNWFRVWYAF